MTNKTNQTITLKIEIHLKEETLCLLVDTPMTKDEWSIKSVRDNTITEIISNIISIEVHDKERMH